MGMTKQDAELGTTRQAAGLLSSTQGTNFQNHRRIDRSYAPQKDAPILPMKIGLAS